MNVWHPSISSDFVFGHELPRVVYQYIYNKTKKTCNHHVPSHLCLSSTGRKGAQRDTGWTPQALNSHHVHPPTHPWAKTWKKTVHREQKTKNGRTLNQVEWLCEAKPFQSSTMDWLCEAKQSNQNGLALRSKANPSLKRLCEAKPIHHDGKALRSKANPS